MYLRIHLLKENDSLEISKENEEVASCPMKIVYILHL